MQESQHTSLGLAYDVFMIQKILQLDPLLLLVGEQREYVTNIFSVIQLISNGSLHVVTNVSEYVLQQSDISARDIVLAIPQSSR